MTLADSDAQRPDAMELLCPILTTQQTRSCIATELHEDADGGTTALSAARGRLAGRLVMNSISVETYCSSDKRPVCDSSLLALVAVKF